MLDYVSLDSTPFGEDCEQLGENYDPVKARKENKAFIRQIRRVCGEEPAGARLKIKSNGHDFGFYTEVVCEFSDDDEEATDYAYSLESDERLEYWDEEAKKELGI